MSFCAKVAKKKLKWVFSPLSPQKRKNKNKINCMTAITINVRLFSNDKI